jgi:hypothetical protein
MCIHKRLASAAKCNYDIGPAGTVSKCKQSKPFQQWKWKYAKHPVKTNNGMFNIKYSLIPLLYNSFQNEGTQIKRDKIVRT